MIKTASPSFLKGLKVDEAELVLVMTLFDQLCIYFKVLTSLMDSISSSGIVIVGRIITSTLLLGGTVLSLLAMSGSEVDE